MVEATAVDSGAVVDEGNDGSAGVDAGAGEGDSMVVVGTDNSVVAKVLIIGVDLADSGVTDWVGADDDWTSAERVVAEDEGMVVGIVVSLADCG